MNEIQHDHIDILKTMFFDYFAETAVSVSLLTPHASARNYFLLESENNKVIGVYGTSLSENKAFINIQQSFQKQGIRVPQVFAVHDSSFYYLQEYCGSLDLFSYLPEATDTINFLKKTVQLLVDIQTKGNKDFDFSVCYPFSFFDNKEIKREFQAFQNKYLFHKGIQLEEHFFQKDIETVEHIIGRIPQEEYVFMHRDFQTRNILVNEDTLVIIDFQGGRCGPRYYDLTSFMYSPESSYAYDHKQEIIDFYRKQYEDRSDITIFMQNFLVIAVIRLIHDLGVYGHLGLEQNNEFFRANIPTAEKYLREILLELEKNYNIYFDGLKTVLA